jgi:hypothetical protein
VVAAVPGESEVKPGPDAVGAWHELLDADQGRAVESAEQLAAALTGGGLTFGGRPLCTVLRPRFFTPREYRELCDRLALLMRGFRAAFDRAVADPAARRQFRLADWEEALVVEDRSGIPPGPTTRMDAFVVPGTKAMAITEYNAETPAGAAFNDALADVFWDLPVTRGFARDWWLRPLEARHGVRRVLVESWERWRGADGATRKPRVAILDWADVPTAVEFELFRRDFTSRGFDCVIGDPRACEYRGGRLLLDGSPVDLIYKRVLLHELVEREGMESQVMRAVRDNAVCLLNGVRSKILHKKAALAVLSDEANADWFTAEVHETIAAYVPWTRVVEPRRTRSPDGGDVDLLRYAADNREQLVLKPNDAYGGEGIVLGWTVADSEWEAALVRAVAEPYVVQRRVTIPREPYPSLVDGRIVYADRQVDTAPFVCDSSYVEGVLTRLSTAELLNVTAGGGSQTPTFLVEPR